MLNLVLLATTLWVCPGDVYSNEPRPGCKPFHESNKEGFSTVPEAKPESAPAGSRPAPTPFESPAPRPAQPAQPLNAERCALYAEYLRLNMKISGGNLDATSEDVQRFDQLRNLFGLNSPPNCP
jgi:hypothetical protein